jgi:hypothetical protein
MLAVSLVSLVAVIVPILRGMSVSLKMKESICGSGKRTGEQGGREVGGSTRVVYAGCIDVLIF